MMDFFDNVKNAFGSKKEDVESQNNVNDEVIDKSEPIESIENNNVNLNGNEEIKSEDSEEIHIKDEIIDKPTQAEKIRNFKYLDDLIHSGIKEIVLDSDIVLDDDEKFEYKDGIKLDVDDLSIGGNGHTIDAQGLTRIFYCTGKNITIENIILRNGYAEENGGAIHNSGELTITSSTLTENTARDGGAISNNGELTVTKSKLTENTAHASGAIRNIWKGKLTITESTLMENTADGSGAIFNSGQLIITESTLMENTAQKDGGAIYNSGELRIHDSTLNYNTSHEGSGGAINNRGKLTITESTLMENTAQKDGGAIMNSRKSELTITESTLNNNTANRDGGAIYSDNKIHMNNCTLIDNLQSSFSFVENDNKYDIRWNDDFISYSDVTIYLDNKFDGEYHITDNVIEWNKILSNGNHEIILELNDKNRVIMNFTYSPEVIIVDVSNYEELINSINKAKLIITPEYIINLNEGDYNATKPIIWKSFSNSNLIINGNGLTLNGQNTNQFIKIGTNAQLTLNNIILTNYVADYGGVIHNNGQLTLTKTTLTRNTAKDCGVIFNDKGEITITESTLNENNGLAIYDYMAKLTITESTLNENNGPAISEYRGKLIIISSTLNENNNGAIYNGEGELTITRSTITGNTAEDDGGAIRNSYGKLTITESALNNNIAERYGGAIHTDGGELTITESTLSGNTAQDGGAIYNILSDLTITKSTFNENKVEKEGIIAHMGNIKMMDCEFLNNKSADSIIFVADGFLHIYNLNFHENKSKYVIFNRAINSGIFYSEFIENSVREGVINNDAQFCTIEKSIFENNLANSNSKNIINNGKLTLINPQIRDKCETILNEKYILIKDSPQNLSNKIYGDGIVEVLNIPPEKFDFGYLDKKIHESPTKEIVIDEDICLETYESDFYEGGIELDVDNLVINGNGKSIDGANKSRIFIITGKNITLKNITFKNGHIFQNLLNHPNNNGGAIKINHNFDTTFENCRFINNVSEENGGAIYKHGGELTIIHSTFEENISRGNILSIFKRGGGGAIYNNDGKLIIMKSSFNKNISENNTYGGAIYNNKGQSAVKESTLNQNRAEKGGAIYNNKGESVVKESTLSQNTAKLGGALANGNYDYRFNKSNLNKKIHNDRKLTIISSKLSKNTAEGDGGAILNHDGELIIIESVLNQNTAEFDGGAIYNHYGELTITDSALNNNSTKYFNGGAIFNILKSKAKITRSTLNKNTTNGMDEDKGNGGAIYNHYSELTITESSFRENMAQYGGAIKNYHYSELTIIDSALTYNNSARDGGAIQNNNDCKLTIVDSTIIGNTAKEFGGAIRNSGELTIAESTLTGNAAKRDGGAIRNSGELTITESTLTGNAAKGFGGAVRNNGELTIAESTLTGNTAQHGGAIFLSKSIYKSKTCTFKDNKPDDVYEF